jgi:hypothetical protein
MSAAKHTPGPWAAEAPESLFAQLKANGKCSLLARGRQALGGGCRDGDRRAAEDETNALADGLVDAAKRCASLHGALFGAQVRTCIPWLAALRAAGRLP